MAWPQGTDSFVTASGSVLNTIYPRGELIGTLYPGTFAADAIGITFPFTFYRFALGDPFGSRSAEVEVEIYDQQSPADPYAAELDPDRLVFRLQVAFELTVRNEPSDTGNVNPYGGYNPLVAWDYNENVAVTHTDGRAVSAGELNEWVVAGGDSETATAANERLAFIYNTGTGGSEFGGRRWSRIYQCWLHPRPHIVRTRFTEVIIDANTVNREAYGPQMYLMPMAAITIGFGEVGNQSFYNYNNVGVPERRVAPLIGAGVDVTDRFHGFLPYRAGANHYAETRIARSPGNITAKPILNGKALDTSGFHGEDGSVHVFSHTLTQNPDASWTDHGYKQFSTYEVGRTTNDPYINSLGPTEWTEMTVFTSPNYRQFQVCQLHQGGAAAVASYVEGNKREVHFKLRNADGTWPADDAVIVVKDGLSHPQSVSIDQTPDDAIYVLFQDLIDFTAGNYYRSRDGGRTWEDAG